MATEAPHIEARNLAELRDWLNDNHATSGSVWLVTFKKGHADHLPFGEVVEELLCWGWVDSSVRGIDDVSFKHLISPRKETSAWSAVNKEIVERMRAEGRMQPSGEAKIAAAKANGMWDFLDDVERLQVPDDLLEALNDARRGWDNLPRSTKRGLLERLKRAKTSPTRAKRVAECVEAAAKRLEY